MLLKKLIHGNQFYPDFFPLDIPLQKDIFSEIFFSPLLFPAGKKNIMLMIISRIEFTSA